jgi:putative OPT family oligopeptide transporter
VLSLLAKAYGIGVPTAAHPNALLAPQATLMASVARAMFGGELPWHMVWVGVGVGAFIIALDEWLKKRGAAFRVPVLAAAVGIYLPLEYTMPIFLGGFLTYLVERGSGKKLKPDERERVHRKGVLFSAGLITGEALTGILIAIPIVLAGRDDVLALPPAFHFGAWIGLIVLAAVAIVLYRIAASSLQESPVNVDR